MAGAISIKLYLFKVKDMKPTKEQERIHNFVKHDSNLGIIDAVVMVHSIIK